MAVSTAPLGPPTAPRPETAAPASERPRGGRPTPEARIEVQGAGKRFGDTWVVRNLNFEVEPGTIFGLFGPSGSGKTTTIRLLLGLYGRDEGQISVLGTDPRRFRARVRGLIGYMPQLFVLYPELSVQDNLDLVASLYGLLWWRRGKAMRRVLEFVELWEHRRKSADELSGGMKRRLELATALVHNPKLIVFDEPTAGVDPILRAKFWEHFHELRDQGRTIVVTSQYVTEAEYCDQVGFLGRGELVAIGTPESVRHQAFGGEMVDVVADGLDRRVVAMLEALPFVRGTRRPSYEELQLAVDDAAVAIPQVLTTLADSGVEVKQVQEYRPNFDEVFVRLMEQSNVESVE